MRILNNQINKTIANLNLIIARFMHSIKKFNSYGDIMDMEKQMDGSNLLVKLNGRLDTETAPELTEALKDDLPNVKDLTFDLSDLIYISSAGLRVILSTQKIMMKQGSMKLVNVQDIVMEVFDATGFSDILTIE